jgi:hypothetical protein
MGARVTRGEFREPRQQATPSRQAAATAQGITQLSRMGRRQTGEELGWSMTKAIQILYSSLSSCKAPATLLSLSTFFLCTTRQYKLQQEAKSWLVVQREGERQEIKSYASWKRTAAMPMRERKGEGWQPAIGRKKAVQMEGKGTPNRTPPLLLYLLPLTLGSKKKNILTK